MEYCKDKVYLAVHKQSSKAKYLFKNVESDRPTYNHNLSWVYLPTTTNGSRWRKSENVDISRYNMTEIGFLTKTHMDMLGSTDPSMVRLAKKILINKLNNNKQCKEVV